MSVAKHRPRPTRRPDGATGAAARVQPLDRPTAEEVAGLLDLVDQAVLMCDEAGTLRWCNAAARTLLPGLQLGEAPTGALAGAEARGADHFDAEVRGRVLRGHRVEHSPGGGVGRHVWLVRDMSDAPDHVPSAGKGTARSVFLAEAGRNLGASLHPGRTVRAVVEAAVPTLADTAVVFLPSQGAWTAWHRAGPDRASGRLAVTRLDGAPLLAKALRGLFAQPARCEPPELAALAEALGTGWDDGRALVVTLPGAGAPSGVLVLVRGSRRPGFDAADLTLAGEFAARAGTALAAAALYTEQVDVAAALHDELVPDALPQVPGLRLAAAYRPAHEGLQLSGDFYQVIPRAAGGGADFIFGDVCGNGAQAAVTAGRVQRSLRTFAAVERQPVAVLRRLNEILLQDGTAPFATLVVGSARPTADGGLELLVAGGGHLPPLLLRATGRVEVVDIGGTLVGALPEAEFDHAAVRLAAGELMLLYSDGFTEARGGPAEHDMYGEQRLIHDLTTCAGMPAGAVAERLDLLLGRWLAGRPHDDLALLVVQAAAASPTEHPGRDDDGRP